MAAAKDGVKVQLNLKAGNDLLNVYAVNARELNALVEEIVEVSPAIAVRFGLKVSEGLKNVGAAAVAAEAPVGAAAPSPEPEQATEAPVGAAVAPATTSTEGLSPRDKARARLKGASA